MAGGIGRPFALNEKCIFFSLICMALFLYKPNFQNENMKYFALFIIFVFAYVAMAWYDYYFNCDTVPLKKGTIGGITGQFKPDSPYANKETENDKKMRQIFIYLSHLVFIVPLLIYVAYYKNNINPITYPLLGALAVFTASYHGIALMVGSH